MATKNSSSQQFRYPEWQPQYKAALLEVNPINLAQRIQEAQAALFNRLRDLSRSSEQEREREAIENALGALQVLTREILKSVAGKQNNQAAT